MSFCVLSDAMLYQVFVSSTLLDHLANVVIGGICICWRSSILAEQQERVHAYLFTLLLLTITSFHLSYSTNTVAWGYHTIFVVTFVCWRLSGEYA